jgi:MFS superfamily sulfate permease-like transporter
MQVKHNNNSGGRKKNLLTAAFPFLAWLKGYNIASFRADLVSGVTVALVLVPQSMAYAQLAGLPAYYGLYASFLPPMIAALFGSSRQLATGPVAVVSLMTATALAPLATAGSEAFIAYAILLALLVGLFQLSLGILRFGLVVNFLSHPVVNGFTNAAALIIATSQLSKLFGVSVDSAEHHYQTVYLVIKAAVAFTHWPTLAISALAFAVMVLLKRMNPRIPYVLVAVILATVVSWVTGFEHNVNVPIEQIQNTRVTSLVTAYNETLIETDRKATARVALTDQHKDSIAFYSAIDSETESREYHLAFLKKDFEHRSTVLNLEMEELKKQSGQYRSELREIGLLSVSDSVGKSVFCSNEQLPSGSEQVGSSWRIKVGEKPLNLTSITLIGGGDVIGTIPRGLPRPRIPKIDLDAILNLFPMAAIISLLGFMEAISIAKAMAAKTGHRLDPNQELIGQGLANMVGSVSQGYPVSGSFSRSAVNIQAGAVTGISSAVASLFVLLTLLLFTPLLYHLPQSVLAAIIMMAVVGLLNVTGFVHSWKAQRYDGIIGIITFLCTLAFAPHLDKGILVGVGLSLILHLLRSMKPDIALLSKHPDGTYRNRERFGLRQCRHIAVIRYNGSLFFANVNYLEKEVLDVVSSMPELKHVLIVGNGINELDASGEETLSHLVDRLREAGYDVSISGLNDSVLDAMRRTFLFYKIGEDHLFRNASLAIESIYASTHLGSDEDPCPLIQADFTPLKVADKAKFSPAFQKAVESFVRKKKSADESGSRG